MCHFDMFLIVCIVASVTVCSSFGGGENPRVDNGSVKKHLPDYYLMAFSSVFTNAPLIASYIPQTPYAGWNTLQTAYHNYSEGDSNVACAQLALCEAYGFEYLLGLWYEREDRWARALLLGYSISLHREDEHSYTEHAFKSACRHFEPKERMEREEELRLVMDNIDNLRPRFRELNEAVRMCVSNQSFVLTVSATDSVPNLDVTTHSWCHGNKLFVNLVVVIISWILGYCFGKMYRSH